ncbi:MAG: hypothetical protein RDU25_00755 [Patescibacteria group bacterium]|nr:hypothetical protein [Patescibacteria group bacterium]
MENVEFEEMMAKFDAIAAEDEDYDLNDSMTDSAAIAREEIQPFIDAKDASGLLKVMADAAQRRCLGTLMVGIWSDPGVPNEVIELMMPEFIRISSDRHNSPGCHVILSPDDGEYLYDRGLHQWWGEVYAILKRIYGDDW